MKVVKYALGKQFAERQIYLDDNGKTHIVYVMPRGLQLLTLGEEQPTLEESAKIMEYCHEFIKLYNEDEVELENLVKASAGAMETMLQTEEKKT